MKYINYVLLLLFFSSTQVSALALSAQPIRLSMKNASLERVLKEITKQSGYVFWYEAGLLENSKKTTIFADHLEVEEVLKEVFRDQPFSFDVIGKTVVVKPGAVAHDPSIARQIQDNIRVSGEVTDSTGSRLASVSVSLKGRSNIGTLTDLHGRYVLDVPPSGILVFSMVGYETVEVPVTGRINVDLVMKASAAQIDDVVIVGFGGQQRRTDMIGSVVSVKPDDLKVPSSNLTTALAGRVPGMIAFQRSGEPGMDNADFFIRGVTTFGYKVDPLILIDNVEVTTTDLARMQVDDIADFSIMKDATATAVYGARGANGVILITTKQGKEGPAAISLRVENSLSTATRNVELADPITYMRMANEAVLTRSPEESLPYSQRQIDNTVLGQSSLLYPVTDWRNELIKPYTMNQRANLSVSGGGKVARYFVSGALNQDNGILKVHGKSNFNNNIDLKTYSLRSNVNINLSPTTEMIVRMSGSFDDYTGPVDGGTKVYRDIMRTSPTLFAPYFPAEGDYEHVRHIMFGNALPSGDYLNPYANLVSGYREYSRAMMLAQLELKQNLSYFIEGLSFRALANTTRNSFFDVRRQYGPFFYHFDTGSPLEAPKYTLLNEARGTEYLDYVPGSKTVSSVFYLEAALNYNRTFNDRHTFSGMLVNIMRNELSGNAGSLQLSLPFRNLGLSGRFTYAYDSRYHAEFNFGYNGSERFYETNRFGFFPSVGVAWSVSNEPFWEPIKPVISNLRLRGTYGLVGNDAIGSPSDRFFYLSNVEMNSDARGHTFGRDRTNTKLGIELTRYSNPDITWETAYKSNIALELGLFDRLQITADWFSEHRKNILMERSDIPTTMGLAAPISANLGEAKGKGFDFSASYQQSFVNGLWIQGMANFTYATSVYEVYEEPEYEHYWLTRVGYPISVRRGYIAERLFIDDEEVANSPQQHFGEVRGGDIKYMDLNGDGQITELDKAPLGYPQTPEINYGFGFSAGFKGFDASVFFQGLARESFWIGSQSTAPFRRYVYSGENYNKTASTATDRNPYATLHNQVLKAYADSYWSEDNRDLYALWPRLTYEAGNQNNEQVSTWFMRDGAFLRLKQVELGYELPKHISERIRAHKFRVYLNATNLATWSNFKLWDVEMAGNGLGYPIQRVFNVGIQLSF